MRIKLIDRYGFKRFYDYPSDKRLREFVELPIEDKFTGQTHNLVFRYRKITSQNIYFYEQTDMSIPPSGQNRSAPNSYSSFDESQPFLAVPNSTGGARTIRGTTNTIDAFSRAYYSSLGQASINQALSAGFVEDGPTLGGVNIIPPF